MYVIRGEVRCVRHRWVQTKINPVLSKAEVIENKAHYYWLLVIAVRLVRIIA